MSKNISDLRDAMFDTLQLLNEGKITIEQAKAASEVGQVIINSAKVEVDYIRANNGGDSEFLDPVAEHTLPEGVTGVVRHRIGR